MNFSPYDTWESSLSYISHLHNPTACKILELNFYEVCRVTAVNATRPRKGAGCLPTSVRLSSSFPQGKSVMWWCKKSDSHGYRREISQINMPWSRPLSSDIHNVKTLVTATQITLGDIILEPLDIALSWCSSKSLHLKECTNWTHHSKIVTYTPSSLKPNVFVVFFDNSKKSFGSLMPCVNTV